MGRSMFPFGSGKMFFKRSTDLGFFRIGVAAMQEGGWSIDVDVKELHGSNRFPVDVRTGMGKIEGTAKYTDWDADVIGTILDGRVGVDPVSTGSNVLAVNVEATIPPTAGPYTVTITVPTTPSAGTYVKSLEVIFAATGIPLEQVATATTPTTGQFHIATTGTTTMIYTFAAADQGLAVKITYMYSHATSGKKVTWGNVPIGTTPILAGIFQGISDAKQMVLELDNVVAHGMKWSQRIDDWSHIDTQLKAFADPGSDVIGRINLLVD